MNVKRDIGWENAFKQRVNHFAAGRRNGFAIVVKVRGAGSREFRRWTHPGAFEEADKYTKKHPLGPNKDIIEHETGPEIFEWLRRGPTTLRALDQSLR